MNRSLFQASPFRPAYGLQPVRAQSVMGSWLDDITGGLTDEVKPLLDELDSWIMKLPVDVAGNYSKRRDECMAKPTFSQYKCLYDLFQEIKNRDDAPAAPPKPPAASPAPASTGIPSWAIAIGGVALAGVLYAAFGK